MYADVSTPKTFVTEPQHSQVLASDTKPLVASKATVSLSQSHVYQFEPLRDELADIQSQATAEYEAIGIRAIRAEGKVKTLTQEVKDLTQEVKDLNQELDELTQELNDVQAKSGSVFLAKKEELEKVMKEVVELQRALSASIKEKDQLNAEVVDLKCALTQAENLAELFASRVRDQMTQERDKLTKRLQDAENTCNFWKMGSFAMVIIVLAVLMVRLF
jgi:chromosome segregation ATPase